MCVCVCVKKVVSIKITEYLDKDSSQRNELLCTYVPKQNSTTIQDYINNELLQ